MENLINERINALRKEMARAGVAATIVPQTDPHMSEYLADHWQARRWLSGFTGSAGSLVVTADKAYIWADSRYWLQAARQLEGTCIGVMEEGKPDVPTIASWLCRELVPGSVVGVDGMVFSSHAVDELGAALSACGIKLETDFAGVASLWIGRPELPDSPVFLHDEKYAGESASSKIAKVLKAAADCGADSVFVSDLAEIAWLLNVRSSDVESNPVATSFLYLAPEGSRLFIKEEKLTADVLKALVASGIGIGTYEEVGDFLMALPSDRKVLANPAQTASSLMSLLGAKAVKAASPVALLKACKNEVQIAGIREAMVRDGVALVKSFMEIERTVAAGERLTEIGVDAILHRNRSAQPLFFEESFGTIAGYGPHGAIVHYSATEDADAELKPSGLLLVDSGASYFDGTTDITRTVALGDPTPDEKRDFTLVMQGHIAIAQAVYPAGTRGAQLDVLARMPLWKHGLSYLHGTGHGVGHFLNVHEGPQSIRLNDTMAPLMPGMVTSDEPGLYRAGKHGIRCENLVLTVPAFTTEFGEFYKFDVLTLFPFDLRLFDTAIMSDDEIAWVNDYHKRVYDLLSPSLDGDEAAWLASKTKALARG